MLKIEKSATRKTTVAYDGAWRAIEGKNAREEIIVLVKRWEKEGTEELKFKTPSPAVFFETVKAAYAKFIIAGGGLVMGPQRRLLVICRKGRWDLPKGKAEKNERLDKCALREVKEETGLRSVKLAKEFTRTYHTYIIGKHPVLKETVWYLMKVADEKTKPQSSEGITSVDWISSKNFRKISANTYDNILLLLKKYFRNRK